MPTWELYNAGKRLWDPSAAPSPRLRRVTFKSWTHIQVSHFLAMIPATKTETAPRPSELSYIPICLWVCYQHHTPRDMRGVTFAYALGNTQTLVLEVDPELTCQLASASLDQCLGISQGKSTRHDQTVDPARTLWLGSGLPNQSVDSFSGTETLQENSHLHPQRS